MIFIGLDGGGSTVRLGAYTPDMNEIAAVTHNNSVNPSTIGRERAAQRIQAAVHDLITQGNLHSQTISGIGVGISGADTAHSREWLLNTLDAVLPGVPVVASADYEIALVAAHGERYGVLILAGTGSVGYGVNRAGQAHRVGGWGYHIGDEGSGYWLGSQGLRLVAQVADGRAAPCPLTDQIKAAVGIQQPINDLVGWVYHQDGPRNQDIARLAYTVITAADANDPDALRLVERAANDLYAHYSALVRVLELETKTAPVGFAGGLLSSENALSRRLMARLGLQHLPQPRYSPTAGAAKLAAIQLA